MKNDGGFTLVEALVSLFVFSLIAAGCTVLLMQGVESQKRVAMAQASLRELQAARSLLANDMLQLAPRRVRNPDGGHAAVFLGGEQGVSFVRVAAEPNAGGVRTTLAYITYGVEDGRVMRWSRTILDAAQAGGADASVTERVVFAHAEDARFEFFDGAAWRTSWEAVTAGAAPRAVALSVRAPRYGDVRIEALTGGGS